MKLVRSSVAGAVERDQAIRLLTERAVLTRMVCRELLESDLGGADRRPETALYQLLRWINDNQAAHIRVEAQADDGIDHMVVPDDYQDLVAEIRNGAQVCKALSLFMTADNQLQGDSDRALIRDRLAAYWERHHSPAPAIRSLT